MKRPTMLRILQILVALAVTAIIVFYPRPWNISRWIGVVIAVPAMVLLLTAQGQLGASFSVTPQARQLITHGLYSKFRNPIYVFGGLFFLGFILTIQRPALLIIFAIVIPMQIVRARAESKVLEEKFGDEYREYRQKTWF
jgi:protein-S-isoprenylcysteine O-methyltransferase Ste14